MKLTFKQQLAPSLRIELNRLRHGTAAESQRYKNIPSAIAKVMTEPTSKEFSKDLPEGYKAVDVLQQYRLFYRIVHPPESKESTVYFVWLNDNESLHRTGEPDDCYEVFRKMVHHSQIDPYREEVAQEERFELSAEWGAPFIYAKYFRPAEKGDETADSGLVMLSAVGEFDYRITYIRESKPDIGLATHLLSQLCASADTRKVQLQFPIFVKTRTAAWERALLTAEGFIRSQVSVEDEEIWIRSPKLSK